MNKQIQGQEGHASMNPWSLWSRAHSPPLHNNSLHEASQTFPHIVLTCHGGLFLASQIWVNFLGILLPTNVSLIFRMFALRPLGGNNRWRQRLAESEAMQWKKSVKKWFQFCILVYCTPFCCSCSSSLGGCHRFSLVWASCLIHISASHLVWFWPEGLCQETLLPGLTQEYPPKRWPTVLHWFGGYLAQMQEAVFFRVCEKRLQTTSGAISLTLCLPLVIPLPQLPYFCHSSE